MRGQKIVEKKIPKYKQTNKKEQFEEKQIAQKE